jgi:hypothetical protein
MEVVVPIKEYSAEKGIESCHKDYFGSHVFTASIYRNRSYIGFFENFFFQTNETFFV